MLSHISLNFGSAGGSSPLQIEPGPMTIFVGPNNSGKSLILREIYNFTQGQAGAERKIIRSIRNKVLTRDIYRRLLLSLHVDDPTFSEKEVVNARFPNGLVTRIHLGTADQMSRGEDSNAFTLLTRGLSIFMDGQARLTLSDAVVTSSEGGWHNSALGRLFHDKASRERLNQITQKALKLYFTIDPTELSLVRVKLSGRPPQTPDEDEWALDERGKRFFRQAEDIWNFSDGVKAFTGIMIGILSAEYMTVLIDEPEAFLHPPLVRELASNLTEIAAQREANIFAATHSPDFLMGCVQTNRRINIIRLTYTGGIGTATYLPADEVQKMMRNPFLRSAGVLSSLFYEGAVVGESDVDRAFYQEINQRNIEADDEGMRNVVFLNANGKDSLRHVISPLRRMGIPAAAIVDLDIIEPGTFRLLLEAASVPKTLIETWVILKDKINGQFNRLGVKPKKAGLSALDEANRVAAYSLIDSLVDYGIFVVPVGEVENWLPQLGLKGKATYWLEQVFTTMGDDPSSPSYVRPADDDVWQFVRRIKGWVDDPERLGMP